MSPEYLDKLLKVSPGVKDLVEEIRQLKEINEALVGRNKQLREELAKSEEFKTKLMKFLWENGNFSVTA